jgi:bifunctional ADP-heptose synthase (sugar kinase/adenylyltransferase)
MTIDDKINNIKRYIEEYVADPNKKVFESILDILKEINEEIDELNDSIHF